MSAFLDIRYAARALRRNRGFAVTSVLALSAGIASNTAIFSVVNKVLLEPLPYRDPDGLVQLMSKSPLGDASVVSIPKFGIWRDYSRSFQAVAAYDFDGPAANLTEDGASLPLATARVSADYFRLFGADVIAGRTFSDGEDSPGAQCVAVIGANLWRGRFRSNPMLTGRAISLDHRDCKVVGVLDSKFTGEKPIDIWLPLAADFGVADHMSRVRVAARLKPCVTVEEAAVDVRRTAQWFSPKYPNAPMLFREEFTAVPLRDALVGDVRPALLLLTGAVGFLLLIACANAGSLALARATRRTREMAVRSALGAARDRLIRASLTESMLIAFLAAITGLVLGFCGVRGLLFLSPADLPRAGANGSAIAMDGRVFLFTLAVSLCSCMLFGLMPAIAGSRPDVMSLVNDAPAQSGMGFRRGKGRAALVICQVALALVLLMGAGLLIRTFVAFRTADGGFDERQVLTVQTSLDDPRFERTEQVVGLVQRVKQRIAEISGPPEVATTSSLPLQPGLSMPFTITRHDQVMTGQYHGAAAWRSVSPDYFNALHIRLLRGRMFSKEDDGHAAKVALINRMMMRKYWPEIDSNPIGEFMIIGKGISKELEDEPRQIVGIVDDIRRAGMNREPMMYVPVAQLPDGLNSWINHVRPITWVIRTSADPGAVEHALRGASGLPLGPLQTMRQVIAAASARSQFYTLLLTIFGVVALLLAAVGLYGVMSYSVEERTREIGIRMALGALPRHIRNMVVWQGMRLVLIGMCAGVPAALALARVMMSMFFGMAPWDVTVIGGVSALLAFVAFAAAYLPSMRAAEVDPCDSLK